jgi:hypothetical protein
MKSNAILLLGALIALLTGCREVVAPEALNHRPVADLPSPLPDSMAVLLAAGDIADCTLPNDEQTAAMLDSLPGTVLTLGDNVYPSGTREAYERCYAPGWGRHRARTYPALGNHDYVNGSAAGYFDYFGARAPATHYAVDVGRWRLIVLNSNIEFEDAAQQEAWLRTELVEHPRACTVAVWHHPRFNSGPYGDDPRMDQAWRILQQAGVEVVLSGHEHLYEHFAPQTASGVRDDAGIREFIVGTGGAALRAFAAVKPNSLVRINDSHGVLALVLRPTSYSWDFVPLSGAVADTGTARCH